MRQTNFSLKKADLFSAVCTVLGIFVLREIDISNLFLFVVLVALFTICMDMIYNNCK